MRPENFPENDITLPALHGLFLTLLLAAAGCAGPAPVWNPPPWDVRVVAGGHDDQGPEDRYRVRYEPITYNQTVKAPLPGLAYEYKLIDWDRDGLIDILANLRRGAGIVFYKNVGSKTEPLFRSLHENPVLMEGRRLPRYFDLADLDGDGRLEIVGFEGEGENNRSGGGLLTIQFNDGTTEAPRWRTHYVRSPRGDTLKAPRDVNNTPRVDAADLDGDGRTDLLLGIDHLEEMFPPERRTNAGYIGGFHDPAAYNPDAGYIQWARNLTEPGGEPTFASPEPLTAGGRPIRTYVNPYPTAFDLNGDGRPDLIVGTHRAELRVFLNESTGGAPRFTDAGLLRNDRDEPIRTYLAIRAEPADLDGDGRSELVAASYYGNQNRYVVYDHPGAPGPSGWAETGYLSIRANPDTPVYGMGNSTIDPVDFDGDGDTDLLLGAEGGFPTIVYNVGSEKRRVFAPAERLKYTDGRPLETFSIEQGDGSHWGPLEWYSDRIAPRARDWDGDGTLDLITGSMGRRLYFFKGRITSGELRFERPVNFRFEGKDLVLPDRLFPAVLDWTGDGRLDLVVSNDPGHVLVYPGTGTLDLGPPIRLDHPGGEPIVLEDYWQRKKGNRSGFDVADWDGDGLRDLVIYMFHRGVFLLRNTGGDTFEPARLLVPLYSHLAGPSVFDWDRDGVPDLLIGGDERRMIEPSRPAHLAVFHGQDLDVPPSR